MTEIASAGKLNFTTDARSFRDRSSRVVFKGQQVCRVLDQEAHTTWKHLASSPLIGSNKLIQTHEIPLIDVFPAEKSAHWVGALQHARIPFVSYPYEWTFGMLKQAALLQLEVLQEAISAGLTLADGTAFNTHWRGPNAMFVDIGSFRLLDEQSLWLGYREFCQTHVYPLMLYAHKELPFQPLMRGYARGIPAEDIKQLFGWYEIFKPGVFDLFLSQLKTNPKTESRLVTQMDTKLLRQQLVMTVKRLQKLIRSFDNRTEQSSWSDYHLRGHYAQEVFQRKIAIVQQVLGTKRWSMVWDLGCNDAYFAKLAAAHADYVVGFEKDHVTADTAFAFVRKEQLNNIQIIHADLRNPSPSQGWASQEQLGLTERGKPDLVFSLALIHHIVIGENIPLADYIQWLRSLNATVVLEFPSKADSMVQQLLSTRRDIFDDYDQGNLDTVVRQHFSVSHCSQVSETRVMYVLDPLNE